MFDLVIPLAPQHCNLFKKNIKQITKHINADRIVIISSSSLINKIKRIFPNYIFLNEDTLIESLNWKIIEKYLLLKTGSNESVGWYFQQFLKMGYALKCLNPFYLVWDSDTLPHGKLDFFSEKKILFSYNEEYHITYFETMEKLTGLKKSFSKSFIVEHMMFDCKIMIELIDKFQSKNTSQPWFLNILDAIEEKDLNYSGFSEYDTYGTYMYQNHKDRCKPRYILNNRMDSIKFPFFFFRNIVSKVFYTLSFEAWQSISLKGISEIAELLKKKENI